MKKALAVLVVINSLFVFRLALQQYDVLVFNNITTFAPDPEVYYFAISGELDESETREFQKYFIELLDKYNLNCYQRFDIDHDLIIWLYTDDEWYLHNIPLTEGALTSVSPGEYYFSNDGEAKGVIYNPIRNENFKIYYLDDFSNGNKSVFYPYHLVTYDENKDYIYAAFTADIKAAYPNLSFTTMLLHLHMGNQNAPFLQEMLFVALTASMVVLGLNAILSKKTKAIQLMKLEGYSTKDIFNKHVLRQIVLVFLINVLATTSLYYSIIETSLSNALPLIYNLAVSLVMLIFVLLSLSTVTLAVILSINANLAVKGKSPLKKWKSLNYLLRVMLILFTASYTINSAYAVFRFLRLEATEDQYLERIENLYTASYVKPQYVGTKSQQNVSFELDTIQALLEKLKGNNGFFFYMGGSPLRVTGLYDEIPLIFASKEYVEQFISNELAAQFADTGKYILIPESLEASTGQIVGHLESEYFSFSGEGLGEVVYYNDDLFPVDPYNYILHGQSVSNAVLLITPSRELASDSYFFYEGSLDEAQEYLDKQVSDMGLTPRFALVSVSDSYYSWKAYFIQELKDSTTVLLAIVLTVIANAYQLSVLNSEANAKRFAVAKAEGHTVASLITNEVLVCIVTLLVGTVLHNAISNSSPIHLTQLLLTYIAIETVLLLGITSVYTRRFADKLG